MDCLFCKIASEDIPAHIIHSDASSIAFLDIHPQSPGHTVIIPPRHMETFLDMEESEVEGYWKGVKKTLGILKEHLEADGFTIGINHGKVSGQSINHLHCHIIPRYEGDEGGSIHSVVSYPSDETVKDVYQRIITHI